MTPDCAGISHVTVPSGRCVARCTTTELPSLIEQFIVDPATSLKPSPLNVTTVPPVDGPDFGE
jgi:hypothetical protein